MFELTLLYFFIFQRQQMKYNILKNQLKLYKTDIYFWSHKVCVKLTVRAFSTRFYYVVSNSKNKQ